MGYTTDYNLTVLEGDSSLIQEFRNECEDAHEAIDNRGVYETSWKWNDPKKDLCDFSRQHPETLFRLSGEDEYDGTIWRLYVKNGDSHYQKAKIVFDEFTPELLK